MLVMHETPSSDQIDSVGYEDGNLYVRFKRGHALYVYYNVPEYIYRDLIVESSPGSYLSKHVKKAHYKYDRID